MNTTHSLHTRPAQKGDGDGEKKLHNISKEKRNNTKEMLAVARCGGQTLCGLLLKNRLFFVFFLTMEHILPP